MVAEPEAEPAALPGWDPQCWDSISLVLGHREDTLQLSTSCKFLAWVYVQLCASVQLHEVMTGTLALVFWYQYLGE